MTPDRLLEHFDRIAKAPEAILRLRRFILDLAVRGKLVEQHPDDEPASELLEHIQAEKVRLVKTREIGNQAPFESIEESEVPFRIPRTWEWVPATFPAYLISDMGKKVQTKDVLESGEFPVVDQGKIFIRGYCNDRGKVIRVEAPIVLFGDHTRETKLIDFDFIVGADGVKLLQPVGLLTDYYYLALRWLPLDSRGYGRHFKLLRAAALPLPPLAEQRRIVAKVDELMALCDHLEAAQAERERRRDRLATASLHRLNNGADANAIRERARFHLTHLPRLTTRPEHIQQLRQTILNLAVRGQLVPQDSNDEPTAELLKRIKLPDKPSRYASRSVELIVGDCGLSVGDPETPLPAGWTRVPMIDVARLESGHTPSRNRPDWWGGDIPWMGLVDARIHHGRTISDTLQHTNAEGIANSAARILPAGTVCFSRTASVGYVVVLATAMATSQDFVNWVPTNAVSSRWLQLVMIAEKPALPRFSKGAVHQTIYYPAWLSMHVSLPPVAEQHRIVAKVDELMALCDQLEAQLVTSRTDNRRLLEAVLEEALQEKSERDGKRSGARPVESAALSTNAIVEEP